VYESVRFSCKAQILGSKTVIHHPSCKDDEIEMHGRTVLEPDVPKRDGSSLVQGLPRPEENGPCDRRPVRLPVTYACIASRASGTLRRARSGSVGERMWGLLADACREDGRDDGGGPDAMTRQPARLVSGRRRGHFATAYVRRDAASGDVLRRLGVVSLHETFAFVV
jgi:hypothetical protein